MAPTPWPTAGGRQENGSDPKLTNEHRADLFAALQTEPPDGGPWSGPKVAAFMRDRFGVEVWPQTGWQWLEDLGSDWWFHAPRHPKEATPEEQRVWL